MAKRNLGNRASRVNRAHMKRPKEAISVSMGKTLLARLKETLAVISLAIYSAL